MASKYLNADGVRRLVTDIYNKVKDKLNELDTTDVEADKVLTSNGDGTASWKDSTNVWTGNEEEYNPEEVKDGTTVIFKDDETQPGYVDPYQFKLINGVLSLADPLSNKLVRFIGTRAEWDALSAKEKQLCDGHQVIFTDDYDKGICNTLAECDASTSMNDVVGANAVKGVSTKLQTIDENANHLGVSFWEYTKDQFNEIADTKEYTCGVANWRSEIALNGNTTMIIIGDGSTFGINVIGDISKWNKTTKSWENSGDITDIDYKVGINPSYTYCYKKGNVVTLQIYLSSAISTTDQTIAILPISVRPKHQIWGTAYAINNGTAYNRIVVRSDGYIVNIGTSPVQRFNITYVL